MPVSDYSCYCYYDHAEDIRFEVSPSRSWLDQIISWLPPIYNTFLFYDFLILSNTYNKRVK